MAMSKEQLELAKTILRRFKNKDLPPDQFSWDYIASEVGAHRTTLYRHEDIKEDYALAKKLVAKHKKMERGLNSERIHKGELEHQIDTLKKAIADLENQLARERERLAYASLVARQKGIDPVAFLDESPLGIAVQNKYAE